MISLQQLAERRKQLVEARDAALTPSEVSIIEARIDELKYLIDLCFQKPNPTNCKKVDLSLELELIGMKPSDYNTLLLETNFLKA